MVNASSGRKRVTKARSRNGMNYDVLLSRIADLFTKARHAAARSVNVILTATYWQTGRFIIEHEQGGKQRAGYGEELLKKLSVDLSARFGRGFSVDSLERMRRFYTLFPSVNIADSLPKEVNVPEKSATLRRKFGEKDLKRKSATAWRKSGLPKSPYENIVKVFPLPWKAYVRLLSVKDPFARSFYVTEALRGGWTIKQLDRQINSLFYERTALSKNKAAMIAKGEKKRLEDKVTIEEEIKDPFLLEFLNLKDEYSEFELEEALIRHLESFLLELGTDFTFVGRQKRMRIDDEWYRVDLVLFHRKLRCLLLIDLKLGRFSHADAGQMHMYCNYAKENWTNADENLPVGLILCAEKGDAMAHYSLDGLPSKVMAAEYRTILPDTKKLEKELTKTRLFLEQCQLSRK